MSNQRRTQTVSLTCNEYYMTRISPYVFYMHFFTLKSHFCSAHIAYRCSHLLGSELSQRDWNFPDKEHVTQTQSNSKFMNQYKMQKSTELCLSTDWWWKAHANRETARKILQVLLMAALEASDASHHATATKNWVCTSASFESTLMKSPAENTK